MKRSLRRHRWLSIMTILLESLKLLLTWWRIAIYVKYLNLLTLTRYWRCLVWVSWRQTGGSGYIRWGWACDWRRYMYFNYKIYFFQSSWFLMFEILSLCSHLKEILKSIFILRQINSYIWYIEVNYCIRKISHQFWSTCHVRNLIYNVSHAIIDNTCLKMWKLNWWKIYFSKYFF